MAGREKNCKWYFSDQPNGQEIGPNNAMEQNFKRHPYASLVRESIQNSLDAVDDTSKPVVVEYSFKEMKGMDYPEFFKLQGHIKGCLDYFPSNPNAKSLYQPMLKWFDGGNKYHKNIGYIRVSDFNTKGMEYKEGDTSKAFYAFVRSAGVSAKDSDSAGGSFGFGKAAYFLLSPISTIIVSTCTQKYNKYFEGISSLCTHLYEGAKKMAVGYYDCNNGKPIEDETEMPSQFRRSEPGTDINILGFNPEDKEDAITEMKEAVLRNFWMAILDNRLKVRIDENLTISKDNIAELIEEVFPDDDDNTRKNGYDNPRPYFDAVRLNGTASRYIACEEHLPMLGHVKLFINKQRGATDKVAYMRDLGMLIFSKRTKTNYGMYGVFYCDDRNGNELLRKLENPAHDEWKAGNWRIAGKTAPQGRPTLQILDNFVSRCLSEIFTSQNSQAVNIRGLEEFLYIPTEYDEDNNNDSNESLTGKPTGDIKNFGSSFTTDIPQSEDNPTISKPEKQASAGHVMIAKQHTASPSTGGNLMSGHGSRQVKNKGGVPKPGNTSETNTKDKEGKSGIYATPVDVKYRTFSQIENGMVYHYVVLHSDEDIVNVSLHFYAVGEESDEELQVVETGEGSVNGSIIQGVHVQEGHTRLRVGFSDNMKHSLKLSAEEVHEV